MKGSNVSRARAYVLCVCMLHRSSRSISADESSEGSAKRRLQSCDGYWYITPLENKYPAYAVSAAITDVAPAPHVQFRVFSVLASKRCSIASRYACRSSLLYVAWAVYAIEARSWACGECSAPGEISTAPHMRHHRCITCELDDDVACACFSKGFGCEVKRALYTRA